ncbi:MAG: potassium channel protein [archaeon GB-1867-035]|nr:potassium channel protein [Candidatus Culexmicrobium profundum]
MSLEKIENLLLRLLDTSRTMIDLAYSALLYNDKVFAEEVLKLEEEVDELHTELELEALKLKRQEGEERGVLGLIRLGLSAEAISDAAASIADVVARGFEPHPILRVAFNEAEEGIALIRVDDGSELDGKSLDELELDEMGIKILAVKKLGGRWIRNPPGNLIVSGQDLLMVSGYRDSIEELREMASSSETEEE